MTATMAECIDQLEHHAAGAMKARLGGDEFKYATHQYGISAAKYILEQEHGIDSFSLSPHGHKADLEFWSVRAAKESRQR